MSIRRGLKVPQSKYSHPFLESLWELTEGAPGTPTLLGTIEKPQAAKVKDINYSLFQKIKKLLTEIDYQLVSNGETRWENTARWEKKSLLERSLIEQVGHGLYKLTPKGMESLKEY